jgi:hypothetical protein
MRYTVVVEGRAYNVQVGNNLSLKFSAGLAAQAGISLSITYESGVTIAEAPALTWLSNVQVTPAGVNLPRVLDLTGLPVQAGYVYTVTAGAATGTFTAQTNSTAQDVLTGLAANFNSRTATSGVTVVAQNATVSAVWTGSSDQTGVLDLLKTRI